MPVVEYTATSFYADRKAALLAERGSVGKHDDTGNELPRLMYADKISLPALLVPFVVRTLEALSYSGGAADGLHVYSLPQASAGAVSAVGKQTQLVKDSSEGATLVEFENTIVTARTIMDWLRVCVPTDKAGIRNFRAPGTVAYPYYFWAKSEASGELARKLLEEWNTVIKEASRPPGAGQVWLTRLEVQAFLSAFYRACARCNVVWAMDTSWIAEAEQTAKQATKDAATEIGDLAAGVADVAGDAVGRFGSSFLSQVGIVGAIFVVGLIYLKKTGVL